MQVPVGSSCSSPRKDFQRCIASCSSVTVVPHQALICIFKKASHFPKEKRIHLYKHCIPPTKTATAHVGLAQATHSQQLKMAQKTEAITKTKGFLAALMANQKFKKKNSNECKMVFGKFYASKV